MTARTNSGGYAPDGSTYVTITDGSGSLGGITTAGTISSTNPLPVISVPGATVLGETYILDISSQKSLVSGKDPEDGSTSVSSIPNTTKAVFLQCQGDRTYYRLKGTTVTTTRANYLDPGQYVTVDTDPSKIIFKGSVTSVIMATFLG